MGVFPGSVTVLLECMGQTFGNVHEYDKMIGSLYEIRQKEGESMGSTCYKSMKLWQSSAVPTETGSQTKGRTWCRTNSIMDWHLACVMPWGS